MFSSSLCGPSLVYIGFSLIQIIIDIYKKSFSNGFMKFIVMIVFSLILNILCNTGLSVIAWFLVFIPIIMMTIISTLLLRTFGMNPDPNLLKAKVQNITDNVDGSGNNYQGYASSSSNWVYNFFNPQNQNEMAVYGDLNYDNLNRIDRDEQRHQLYDTIYNYYNISYTPETRYDLSSSPTTYNFIDNLINQFGNSYFMNSIRGTYTNQNPGYNPASNNGYSANSGYTILDANGQNQGYIDASGVPTSYDTQYNDTYKIDGYMQYRESKFNKVKAQLQAANPGSTEDVINVASEKQVQSDWDGLSATAQNVWNGTGTNSSSGTTQQGQSYDPNNFSKYLYNTQKSNVDQNKKVVCAPGHSPDGSGNCINNIDYSKT